MNGEHEPCWQQCMFSAARRARSLLFVRESDRSKHQELGCESPARELYFGEGASAAVVVSKSVQFFHCALPLAYYQLEGVFEFCIVAT